MVKTILAFFCFLSLFFLAGCCHNRATSAKTGNLPSKPIVIALIGDSTVADFPPEDKMRGWGQMIPEFFNKKVTVKNFALCGRSTKSFLQEGSWDKALASKADYYFIQFGHNDLAKDDRGTNPDTDYQDNLLKYINDSRKSGAQPVLVTPVALRNFNQKGTISTILDKYSAAMQKVGQKTNTPVIDLHAKSIELYESLGKSGVAYMDPKPGDKTHFTEEGARLIAKLVADEIRIKVPSLAEYLKKTK
jgi:lysophospholipase L1-like esterase